MDRYDAAVEGLLEQARGRSRAEAREVVRRAWLAGAAPGGCPLFRSRVEGCCPTEVRLLGPDVVEPDDPRRGVVEELAADGLVPRTVHQLCLRFSRSDEEGRRALLERLAGWHRRLDAAEAGGGG